MMDGLWVGAFAISVSLIVYHHVGYPLLLKWYSSRHPLTRVAHTDRGYRTLKRDRALPNVTVLIPAYNEAAWIAEKIRNLAYLDYPKTKLRVLIVCDGCTDNTVQEAESTIQEAICADTHFEVIANEKNQGKVAILNHYIPKISTDITAISDVSALISIDALIIAAEQFQDQSVGVVNATYQLLDNDSGESAYWQYQNQIKYRETTLGSTIGSHGALYFIRTALFTPLPTNAINDDFLIPMQIIKSGYRATYAENMNAVELESTNLDNDFKRRVRISAGNMQQTMQLFGLLSPHYKGVAFAFFSGKGLRLITPYLMIIALVSCAFLSNYPIFSILFSAQILIYIIAILGVYIPSLQRLKVIQLITYVILGHTANLIGGLRYLLGLENGKWKRITR
ncbi:glycosyltransferase family 2 protein [Vibrio sp. 10N.286.49.B1]